MSDTSNGPGWWLASDGKWYPPDTAWPGYAPLSTPAPLSNPGFFGTHKGLKIAGIVVAALFVLGAISAALGGGKKTPAKVLAAAGTTAPTVPATAQPASTPAPTTTTVPTTTTRAPTTTTGPPTTQGPKVSKQAVRYIGQHSHDANTVQAGIETVQTDIGLIAQNPGAASQSDIDQLATLAQQVHDDLNGIKDDFYANADGTGQNQTWEFEIADGANKLKNAMGALVTYTGNPNAATFASFDTQYNQAVAEWNDGTTNLWQAANMPTPPTIPTS